MSQAPKTCEFDSRATENSGGRLPQSAEQIIEGIPRSLTYCDDGMMSVHVYLDLLREPFFSMATRFVAAAGLPEWRTQPLSEHVQQLFQRCLAEGESASDALFRCELELDRIIAESASHQD